MNTFNAVNPKRLWMLLSALWCIFSVFYYYTPVSMEYSNFKRTENYHKELERDKRFEECLIQHGANWEEIRSTFRTVCDAYVDEHCRGRSGSWSWCAKDLLEDMCFKLHAPKPCMGIVFFDLDDKDNVRKFKESFSFQSKFKSKVSSLINFATSGYADDFRLALILFFSGPIAFPFIPKIAKRCWAWLTSP